MSWIGLDQIHLRSIVWVEVACRLYVTTMRTQEIVPRQRRHVINLIGNVLKKANLLGKI
jgi:hypothetical protein